MDDRKLNALLTAVKRGSFSKAAEELGYTQSGLTYMMDSLEAELGCTLLRRGYNGVRLTREGECLLPYVKKAVSASRALTESAKKLSGRKERIRIGAYASISVNWLPRVIAAFSRENAGVAVEIRVEGDEQLRRWLDDGGVELAFLDRTAARDYEWTLLWEEPLLAAVPRDFPLDGPVTVQKLLSFPFVTSGDEDLDRILPRDMGDQLIQVSSADDTAIVSMVEQGLGVSVVPALSLKRRSELVRSLPLDPPCTRAVGIAVKSLRLADPLTRKFINFCKKTGFAEQSP